MITPLFGMWIKPMTYLDEKSKGDSSMSLKLILDLIVKVKKISKAKDIWLKLNCLNSRYDADPVRWGASNDNRPQEYSLRLVFPSKETK